MSWIGRRVIQQIRQAVFQQMLRLPVAYYDQNPSGRMLSRITFDIEQVAEATTNAVTVLIRDSLTVMFLLAYMFWISGWLTLLFLLIGPVLILLLRKVSKRFRQLSQRIQESMGDLTQFVEQSISGQKVIKSFDAEVQQVGTFESVNRHNRKLHLKMALVNSLSAPIVQLVAACMLAVVIYLATQQSINERISVGEFVSFIFSFDWQDSTLSLNRSPATQ